MPSKHVDGSDDGVCDNDDEAVLVHELEALCKDDCTSIDHDKRKYISEAIQHTPLKSTL